MLVREPSSTATPHAARRLTKFGWLSHLSSPQLFVKKRKSLVRLVNKRYDVVFLKMTDQTFFGATTLNIEFYANLIIGINSLGDF